MKPQDIETESFAIIEDELRGRDIPAEHLPVVRRVVHATADFGFVDSLRFHPDAVQAGVAAIRGHANMVTDVNMVKAGISRRFPGDVLCVIGDDEVAAKAKASGSTRAATAMRALVDEIRGGIVVIGNAPTALETVIDLSERGEARPALVVGTPVGFVGAAESKERLIASDLVYISNVGRRGGTPVAVAIVNALILEAAKS